MSTNAANANIATNNSDQAGNTAPNAVHNQHHRLTAIIQKHFDNEFGGHIKSLCDGIGHIVQVPNLVDTHRQQLVWDYTRLIQFLTELSEEVNH